mgnify:CR=1 FL=1
MARLLRSRSKSDFAALANQFEAQINPVFCGPTTAAIILNALQGEQRGASRVTQEGVIAKGPIKYLASWLPSGLEDMNPLGKAAIFMIEVVSHFVRLISLSVRLFANILAGHLLLLFMGGGLAVLLGIAALGVLTYPMAFAFYVFEVGIVATLQAFIFSILTAIYIGGATAESH